MPSILPYSSFLCALALPRDTVFTHETLFRMAANILHKSLYPVEAAKRRPVETEKPKCKNGREDWYMKIFLG
jgi:hypothetical protein